MSATIPTMPIDDLLARMNREGYRVRFVGEGEAVVTNPAGHAYPVSLTGVTFAPGCPCIGHQRHGYCRHSRLVASCRPCPTGCGDVQVYRAYETIGGPMPVYECRSCSATDDARLVETYRHPVVMPF